ncbi:MAG: hypothetical protein NW226_10355 [Microscillaceae bacterium]|nr:hypothetical protein [Microscillaceae bacterium]
MSKHIIHLKDLLLKSNLSDFLLENPPKSFRELLGKPDKEIHLYSEIIKVYYGNYEFEIHRQYDTILMAQNIHPAPAYRSNFRKYLQYENETFKVDTESLMHQKDISWREFQKILQINPEHILQKEESESQFKIHLKNKLQLSFTGESVEWIYDDQGKKKDYRAIHFEDRQDFILFGIQCRLY